MENETQEETQEKIGDSKQDLVATVERLEKANAEMKELLSRQEQLAAKKLLGGMTDAGEQPVQKKVETAAEYAERVLKNKVELK